MKTDNYPALTPQLRRDRQKRMRKQRKENGQSQAHRTASFYLPNQNTPEGAIFDDVWQKVGELAKQQGLTRGEYITRALAIITDRDTKK